MRQALADDAVQSPAFDAVLGDTSMPAPADGGPCVTCAFRPQTEANNTPHTVALAKLCVEGLRPFHCHEKPQLCRGFVAAANLRGVPSDDGDRQWSEAAGYMADVLALCIGRAAEAQEQES